jgi:hypothetical protein
MNLLYVGPIIDKSHLLLFLKKKVWGMMILTGHFIASPLLIIIITPLGFFFLLYCRQKR